MVSVIFVFCLFYLLVYVTTAVYSKDNWLLVDAIFKLQMVQ